MSKHIERLLKREKGIREWLEKNKLESFLEKSDQILESLPREKIKEEYKYEIKRALEHCTKNSEIKALDFQWYYDGSEIGGAYGFGLDSCLCEGNLSNRDFGPEDLPGIELEIEHGDLIGECFGEFPVFYAINSMVKNMNPILEQSDQLGHLFDDTEDVITDYFQIWNYKIGYEVCEELKNSSVIQKLKDRAPFWITMSRHDGWPVAIMLID